MGLSEIIIRGGADALLVVASYLVPSRSGLVALGADLGTAYKGNPRYLYEYLLAHPELEFEPVWVTGAEDVAEELRSRGLPVVHKCELQAPWSLLRAEFIVIDFTPRDVFYLGEAAFGRFRFIQTAHGMPIKKGGQLALEEGRGRRPRGRLAFLAPLFVSLKSALVYNVFLANYELVVAQSEESRKDLAELYVNDNVEVLGAPRNDVLFDQSRRSQVRQRLGLDRYERVLLYCPTWRDEFERIEPFTSEEWRALSQWLESRGYLLMVKKHPLDGELVVPDELENIKNFTGAVDDVQELCVASDVLITDYSSIAFDYCLTGRPIIYYCYDYSTYLTECRGMIYDYFETMPGPFARDAGELMELLETLDEWFVSEDFNDDYSRFAERFNTYRDGASSRRLAEYIKEKLQPRERRRPKYLRRLMSYARRRLASKR